MSLADHAFAVIGGAIVLFMLGGMLVVVAAVILGRESIDSTERE